MNINLGKFGEVSYDTTKVVGGYFRSFVGININIKNRGDFNKNKFIFGKIWRSFLQSYKIVVLYFCRIVGDNINIKNGDFNKNKIIKGGIVWN